MTARVTVGYFEGSKIHTDLRSQVRAAFADGVDQVSEVRSGIFSGVAGYDEVALAPHQLVNCQVFKVRAVGEIDVLGIVRGAREQFVQKIEQGEPRAALRPAKTHPELFILESRIGQPHSQPYVEHRHQKGHRRECVIALIGVDGSARDSHRRAEGYSTSPKGPFACRLVGALDGSLWFVVLPVQFGGILAAVSRTGNEGVRLSCRPGVPA